MTTLEAPAIELRPYQQDALAAVKDHVERGVRRMCVAMPTGCGKCVSPETLVWSDGLRTFGETWGGSSIAGPHRLDAVEGWYDDGVRDGWRMETDDGFEIDGTPAHRLWIRRDDGFEGWLRLDEIVVGDYVALARGRANFGKREMPLEEAYALGLVIADGCLQKLGDTGSNRLQIDKQLPVLAAVSPVLETWRKSAGGNRGGAVRTHEVSSHHAVAAIHAPRLVDFLRESYGLALGQSKDRRVPRSVLRGTRDVVASFLRGYFDGDGYVDRNVSVSSASLPLARQVQALLLGLGVFSSLRSRKTVCLDAHVVRVRDIEAFDREVGMSAYGLLKDTSFRRLRAIDRNTNLDVIPGLGGLIRRAGASVVGKSSCSWKTADAYYDSTRRRPSYAQVKRWLGDMARPDDELERIVSEHRAWSKVRYLTPSRIGRIDCQVADSHAFVGNGLINHNTVVFSQLSSALGLKQEDRILVIAHRDHLIKQAFDKYLKGNPHELIGVEKGERRAAPMDRVVVASVQSLGARRLQDLLRRWGRPKLVITDESHHAASPSYLDVYKALGITPHGDVVHVGVTATPNRADGIGLACAFDAIAYTIGLRELTPKYLVPLVGYRVQTTENLDNMSKEVAGDFDADSLAEVVNTSGRNARIVQAYLDIVRGRRAICFTANVAHSKSVCETFVAAGVKAAHLDGTTRDSERDRILGDFTAGRLEVIVNCMVLTEGYDEPAVEGVIIARPTKSGTLYQQMIGRATRLSPGKRKAFVIDIVDVTRKHRLVTLPSIYGLPPNFNLRGRSAIDASDKFTELVEADPRLAEILKSASQVEELIESRAAAPVQQVIRLLMNEAQRTQRYARVDLMLPPELDADAAAASTLAWSPQGDGKYTLATKENKYTVVEDDVLGNWSVIRRDDVGERRVAAHLVGIDSAFAVAEALVRKERGVDQALFDRDASWRKDPVSAKQIARLHAYGFDPTGLTKGQAQAALDLLVEEIGWR